MSHSSTNISLFDNLSLKCVLIHLAFKYLNTFEVIVVE